jgi:hypothetical protein
MKKATQFYSLIIIIFLFFTACASTSLKSSWKDNRYQGRLERVFVIGVAQSLTVRKIFENEFTKQLKTYGINAIPSYEIISYEEMFDKETIISKIKDLSVDSVLVAKSVAKKAVESYNQAYEQNWYDDYKRNYVTLGYAYDKKSVRVETSLYEVRTEQRIWSALTKTFMVEGAKKEKILKSFIEVIINKMRKDDLLK